MLADGEVIKYKDSATDVAFIAVVRKVEQALCIKPKSRSCLLSAYRRWLNVS